jgi:hypothetical protein
MANPTLVYGISIRKNADLQHLSEQVALAQSQVAQQQAIVDALQGKADLFATSLAQATTNKATALSAWNNVKTLQTNVAGLAINHEMALRQAVKASASAGAVAGRMAGLLGKLIFSVEVINKAALQINRQKALNPMLPDSLVSYMASATSHANNAVALALTALQSCYVAESTLRESDAAVRVASQQAGQLSRYMQEGEAVGLQALPNLSGGVVLLMQQTYQSASQAYDEALANSTGVADQLAFAQAQLTQANLKLGSLQAGLGAAKAAAYAA